MSIIDELVTLLGLEIDPSAKGTAEAFQNLLNGTTKAAGWLGAALVTATAAVEKYTMDQAKAIEEGGRFADSIGMSYEKLQAMEYATTVAGGSVQELRGDLMHLYKTMSSPIPGEYNQTLYMLGNSAISAAMKSKDAAGLLLAVGDRFQSLSKQRQLQFADRLGISAGTMQMLRQGRGEITRLMDEAKLLGIVLDDQAKNKAIVFERSYRRMIAIVQGLGRSITVGLLPGLTKASNAVADWVVANNKLISSGIRQVVEGVGLGFKMVGDAASWAFGKIKEFAGPFASLADDLDATRLIAILLAGAIGALVVSATIAAAPFIAMAAAALTLAIGAEELYVTMKGGKSVLNDWISDFQKAYPNLSRVLKSMGDVLGELGKKIVGVFGREAQIVLQGFLTLLKQIANVFTSILDVVDKSLAGTPADFSELKKWLDNGTLVVPPGGKSSVPASVIQQNSKGGSSNTIEMNINGVGDPTAVGADVVGRLGGLGLQMTNPGTFGPIVG